MDDRLKVLVAMQMRYKVPRPQATEISEAWLQANPGQTWSSLNELIKSGQVVVAGDQLTFAGGAPQSPPSQPSAQGQPPSAPSNKSQRMYRGRPI